MSYEVDTKKIIIQIYGMILLALYLEQEKKKRTKSSVILD